MCAVYFSLVWFGVARSESCSALRSGLFSVWFRPRQFSSLEFRLPHVWLPLPESLFGSSFPAAVDLRSGLVLSTSVWPLFSLSCRWRVFGSIPAAGTVACAISHSKNRFCQQERAAKAVSCSRSRVERPDLRSLRLDLFFMADFLLCHRFAWFLSYLAPTVLSELCCCMCLPRVTSQLPVSIFHGFYFLQPWLS
jgi:hypothetical protein